MAAAAAPRKTRLLLPDQALAIRNVPRKSHSNFFCKSIILVFLLLFFQIFPVQAPDFIRQSIVTELWEMCHLLLIGVAISYGLLSRKTANAQVVGDTAVHLTTDESLAHFSGISHLTSVFENGFENLYDCDDKQRLGEGCVTSQRFRGSVNPKFVAKERRGIHESEENLKKVNQSWFSQYSTGESTAVVSNCKYVFHEGIDYNKPLNLPVRSLHRPKLDKKDNLESRHGKESCLELKSCEQTDCVHNVQKIRGVVPLNLEKRFKEVSGASSIPWRSRSMSRHSEQFEPDRVSRSFQDSTFSSSHEVAKPEEEHLIKDDYNTCSTISASRARNRHSSLGSSSEINGLRVSENSFSDCDSHGMEHRVVKEKPVVESLEPDMESSSLVNKGISRARSVRTIKPSIHLLNENEQLTSRTQDPLADPKLEDECNFLVARQKPSEEESKIELGKRSNEDEDDRGSKHGNESELEGSEVDRKADEFIAKFREQIRLQKASSA